MAWICRNCESDNWDEAAMHCVVCEQARTKSAVADPATAFSNRAALLLAGGTLTALVVVFAVILALDRSVNSAAVDRREEPSPTMPLPRTPSHTATVPASATHTATPRPTATYTATASPTAVSRLYDALSGPSALSNCDKPSYIDGNQLLLENIGGEFMKFCDYTLPFSDGSILVTASGSDQIVLACRHQGANAQIRAAFDQRAKTYSVTAGPDSYLIGWSAAPAMKAGGFNRLELDCIGTEITVVINGTLTGRVQQTNYSTGGWWFGIGVRGLDSNGRFSDLEIVRR